MIRKLAMCAVLLALGGCGSGEPTLADYVNACTAAHQNDAALCRCTGEAAKGKFSADGWRVFVLQAQGKEDEASRLALSMSKEEQSKLITATLEIAGSCGG